MVVAMTFDSAFNKLKLGDPIWLPPKPWESINSECGFLKSNSDLPQQQQCSTSMISEACLVRLAMNVMYGLESSLVCIKNIAAAFCSEPADRTFHRIPNLWNRSLSTNALGNLLTCMGYSGSVVFLLREFVSYFRNLNLDCNAFGNPQVNSEAVTNQSHCSGDMDEVKCPTKSLVNQAFAVSVGKVLEGYISALDTLYASVTLRHLPKSMGAPFELGCFTDVVHSEITLLELYLHTKELMTHIQTIGNICNLNHIALCFSESSPEDLVSKAKVEFHNFPRGGGLLTYLYNQLQVADPPQHSVLQFVFLRACEPYCEFIRRWIFKAEINDPYKEFIVDTNSHGSAGISFDFPVANVKVRHDTELPSFLKDFTFPIIRAGQQLQVVKKLLELCDHITIGDHKYEHILPWSGFSSNHPCFSSLIFNNSSIDDMALARGNFYKKMWQKLDISVAELKFMNRQVVPVGLKSRLANYISIPTVPDSFSLDDSFIMPSPDSMKNSNVDFESVDSGKPNAAEETTVVDPLEFSDCSSSISSEDENVQMLLIDPAIGLDQLEQKYFSALEFSPSIYINSSRKKSIHNEKSESLDNMRKIYHCCTDPIGPYGHFQCKENHPSNFSSTSELGKPDCSDMPGKQYEYCQPVVCWPLGGLLENPFIVDNGFKDAEMFNPSELSVKTSNENIKTLNGSSSMLSKIIAYGNTEKETCYSSWLGCRKPKFHDNLFGMNPMLSKNVFFQFLLNVESKTAGGEFKSVQNVNMPFFDFTLVQNPCKVYLNNTSATLEYHTLHSFAPSAASPTCGLHNSLDKRGFCGDVFLHDSIEHNSKISSLPNIANRSNCEGLLTKSSHAVNNPVSDSSQSVLAMFEMPIDMVIDKCLLQEIFLQYKYISKLIIRLLEKGFNLQEHLLAIRRYHFMELADWADLFITSLQHHNWHVMREDEKKLKIQGLFKSSVERSSCGIDHYKDRFYVYNKAHGFMHPGPSFIRCAALSAGVHSLDFIGLGYVVDWPINIVLTPGALKIYADIFSFLLQIKLAAFALADVWKSMKELTHLQSQNQQPDIRKSEICHFHILFKLRHQLNHFVSTLNQYVQSQLSHVSWFNFLNSPKNKVIDILDLVSVHMAYLNNAMHICFLSKETQCVGSIIENILQCALDFRSCIFGGFLNGVDDVHHLSQINFSQMVEVGERLDMNLKELHKCYAKSSKSSGVWRFWECLNHNDYYF